MRQISSRLCILLCLLIYAVQLLENPFIYRLGIIEYQNIAYYIPTEKIPRGILV